MNTVKNLFLTLLFLLVILLLFLPDLSPDRAGIFFWLSFGACVLVPLLAVVGLLLPCRRWVWKGLYTLALLGSLPLIGTYVPPFWKSPSTDKGTLRVVSWNCHNFGLSYQVLAQASRFIKQRQPHLICLQERPHTNLVSLDSVKAAFREYPYCVLNSREDENLNLIVFSKYPLVSLREYYFNATYNKFLQTEVVVGADTLTLFNVHLQTTGQGDSNGKGTFVESMYRNTKQRNRQALLLRQKIARSRHPVLVCGDFNDLRGSYAYRAVARGLRDAYQQAGRGWGGTYQPYHRLLKIDYMLCSASLRVQSYRLITNSWSDHAMQESSFELTHPE